MQAELRKRNLRTVVLILNWLSAKSTHAKERNNSGLGDALKWTITAVFVIAIAQCITALVELFLYNYLSLEIIAWTVGACTVIPVLVILFVNWKSSKWLENDWGKTHATFSSLREMLKSRLMVCRANSNEKAGELALEAKHLLDVTCEQLHHSPPDIDELEAVMESDPDEYLFAKDDDGISPFADLSAYVQDRVINQRHFFLGKIQGACAEAQREHKSFENRAKALYILFGIVPFLGQTWMFGLWIIQSLVRRKYESLRWDEIATAYDQTAKVLAEIALSFQKHQIKFVTDILEKDSKSQMASDFTASLGLNTFTGTAEIRNFLVEQCKVSGGTVDEALAKDTEEYVQIIVEQVELVLCAEHETWTSKQLAAAKTIASTLTEHPVA